MKLQVRFAFARTTKNSARYEPVPGEGYPAVVGSLYLPLAELDDPASPPGGLHVTIEDI